MRDRIERAIRAVHEQIPEDIDVEEALAQSDELANSAAHIIVLLREEQIPYRAGGGSATLRPLRAPRLGLPSKRQRRH